jgi:hypothetical protein
MPKISKTTNPTGLREIDAKNISVRVITDRDGRRSFWVERFDTAAYKFEPSLRLACVAHAGSTEEYFELGSVEQPYHTTRPLSELAADRPLRFRFLVYPEGSPKLVAYADNIKALDESGNGGESLVDIEPADLNGEAWRLDLAEVRPGTDKPVLLVERQLFPTSLTAARDPWVAVLVMPEVMRQIARVIAENPGCLDDQELWPSAWAEYLRKNSVEELSEDADEMARSQWVEHVVEEFCARPSMKIQFNFAIAELRGEKL